MPFIKTIIKSMLGERTTLRINFDPHINKFWCALPETLVDVVQEDSKLYDNDVNELEKRISLLFYDYNELKITERKVIIFNLESMAWTRTGSGSASGSHTYHTGDLEDADYIKFTLEYVVCFEVKKDGDSKYYRDDRRVYVGMGEKVIDWSQESEDFFLNVQHGISTLIAKLGNFVEKNKDNLPKAIKNQKNLLSFQPTK